MNPNVTYHSYGPPGNETECRSRQQQQQSVVAADATHGRRQDTTATMRNSYLSYASTTNTPSWVNPSTMLETQAQSTPVMRGSRPLPDPSLYHGRNGSQQQQGYGVSMHSGVYGSVRGGRPVSGGYVITNVTEEEEEEEYEERGGGGEAMGHDSDNVGMSRVGGQYRGYQGGTLGYSMPVGMGMGVPMERVATRGTRPLPIPGASQPLGGGSSGKKKSTFVGGFWVGLRRLPKRMLRYGSRKAKEFPEVEQYEHEEDDQQGTQDDQQGTQDDQQGTQDDQQGTQDRQEDQEDQEDQNDQGDQQDSQEDQEDQDDQEDQEDQEDQDNQNDQNDQDNQQEQEQQKSQQSPETAHPAPATDYIKMATSYSSFTDDPSFTTELNPLLRCLHALSRLPWISNRSTVDYRPLAGFGGQPGGRGMLKSNNSWYRRPGDDPSGGGGITGHSLDLLAAEGEGDGASLSAWRRRVAKQQQQHHHHHCHCHRRHRHEHRRYQRRRRRRRQRSTSTITFEEHRQPMPFPYLPAFPGPSEGSTPGRVVYMPMMCH